MSAPPPTIPCRYSEPLHGYTLATPSSTQTSFAPSEATRLHPFATLADAKIACLQMPPCGGVSRRDESGAYEVHAVGRNVPMPSPTGGTAWVKLCESATCEVEDGVWYWGAHIRTVPHLDKVAACCDACLATPSCSSFNFEALSSSCALYASRTERHTDAGYTAGAVVRSPSPPPPSPPHPPSPLPRRRRHPRLCRPGRLRLCRSYRRHLRHHPHHRHLSPRRRPPSRRHRLRLVCSLESRNCCARAARLSQFSGRRLRSHRMSSSMQPFTRPSRRVGSFGAPQPSLMSIRSSRSSNSSSI